ncbi:Putative aldehyde dehydrogenase family 7 member A1 homolog [Eumeta japonica]|uniref:Aldehyde dehydrogenase family 7 member A1 homolog n=1 Tax=Eumeta variegata TaxID=151549 RepID=A0A4C1SLJ1_EUMVA|nr:Putative aldehyde dehydrogenase family 7 member A1 homolog [Eumeta japonica]
MLSLRLIRHRQSYCCSGTGTVSEMEQSIKAGVEAYKEWCLVPAPVRGEIVRQIGDELRKYKEPLGKLVSLSGKFIAKDREKCRNLLIFVIMRWVCRASMPGK